MREAQKINTVRLHYNEHISPNTLSYPCRALGLLHFKLVDPTVLFIVARKKWMKVVEGRLLENRVASDLLQN